MNDFHWPYIALMVLGVIIVVVYISWMLSEPPKSTKDVFDPLNINGCSSSPMPKCKPPKGSSLRPPTTEYHSKPPAPPMPKCKPPKGSSLRPPTTEYHSKPPAPPMQPSNRYVGNNAMFWFRNSIGRKRTISKCSSSDSGGSDD